jgi:hypothetical protein
MKAIMFPVFLGGLKYDQLIHGGSLYGNKKQFSFLVSYCEKIKQKYVIMLTCCKSCDKNNDIQS